MAALSEKALALSISTILLVAGFRVAQSTLFPLVSTATGLVQYNAFVDMLRQKVLQANGVPLRLEFKTSLPSGVSIYSDGKVLILEIGTSLGRRTDRIRASRTVTVQRSIKSGEVRVVVDSTQGNILVKIGGV